MCVVPVVPGLTGHVDEARHCGVLVTSDLQRVASTSATPRPMNSATSALATIRSGDSRTRSKLPQLLSPGDQIVDELAELRVHEGEMAFVGPEAWLRGRDRVGEPGA